MRSIKPGMIVLLGVLACEQQSAPQDSSTDSTDVSLVLSASSGNFAPGTDTIALLRLLERVPPEAHPVVRSAFRSRDDHRILIVDSIEGVPRALVEAVSGHAEVSSNEEESVGNVWAEPVSLVLLENMSTEHVRIARYTGDRGDRLIISRAAASPVKVTAGLRALAALRRRQGIRATRDFTARVDLGVDQSDGDRMPQSWRRLITQKLSDLRHAPVEILDGLGPVRRIELQLGRQ